MFTLPDGTVIEWAYSGHALGPGHQGQQVSRCYLWFRVDGAGWEEGDRFRNTHKLLEWLEVCESLEDFRSF